MKRVSLDPVRRFRLGRVEWPKRMKRKSVRDRTILEKYLLLSQARAPGCDETDLPAGGCVPGRCLGHMSPAVRTSAIGMGVTVHDDAPAPRPLPALRADPVILVPRLHERFLGPPSATHDPDRGPAVRVEQVLLARRHLDDDALFAVLEHECRQARRAGDLAAVAGLQLDVEDIGAVGEVAQALDVADLHLGAGAVVDLVADELALGGQVQLFLPAFPADDGERAAAAGLVAEVDDLAR